MKLLTSLVAAVMLGLYAAPAAAQTNPSRPYRGLFGAGVGDFEQVMTVNASIGAGYDDNIRAEAASAGIGRGSSIDPRNIQGGALGSLSGSLSYSLSRETASITAGVSSTGRLYPDLDPKTVGAHSGSIGGQWRFARRTSLTGGVGGHYRPFALTGFFPGADAFPLTDSPVGTILPPASVESIDLDQAGNPQASYLGYGGNVGVTHRLTRRSTLNLGYLFRTTQSRAYSFESNQHAAKGSLRYDLSKGLGLDFGYGLRRSYYSNNEPLDSHDLRAGILYNRALSFSRHTTLSFATGTAATSTRLGKTVYRATGAASLAHELGRSWTATANYSRGVRFIDTLDEPIFGDAVSISVGGLISRRLQFTSSSHAALGDMNGAQFDTYYQSFALQMAITRFMSLSTNYSYFVYEFDRGVILPPGVPSEIGRQSVRIQASLWAPIFQRARRTNASR
jgi:hypothetical protein